MTLGELIEELAKRNPLTVVKHGFGKGHTDRGSYYDASFDPVEETTIGEMRRHARALLGTTQMGYKGGTFVMHDSVTACIGEWGDIGEQIGRHHFLYWDTFAEKQP